MKKLESLKEVAIYIAQRYVFNEENYPILAKLNDMERKVFAVNHSILHMLKSTAGFESTWFLLNVTGNFYFQNQEENEKRHRTVMTKMLINSLKLLEILGMSPDEVGEIKQPRHGRASSGNFLGFLGEIAAECERFDHGGKFNEEAVKEKALIILQTILQGLNQAKDDTPCMAVPFQFEDALAAVPDYMKR